MVLKTMVHAKIGISERSVFACSTSDSVQVLALFKNLTPKYKLAVEFMYQILTVQWVQVNILIDHSVERFV